jgi:DNA-binding NarL/FixJ family response regulator
MPHPIRIILVDDHNLVREAWKTLLDKDNSFSVIALCRNGAEAIEQARNLLPDIMLMDVNMSPVNGFEATREITEATPSVKIIGVSISDNPKYAIKMLEHGAKGFVTKTSTFAELKTALQKVHAGENYICQEIQKRLSAEE